jgi:hypothetical protein
MRPATAHERQLPRVTQIHYMLTRAAQQLGGLSARAGYVLAARDALEAFPCAAPAGRGARARRGQAVTSRRVNVTAVAAVAAIR